MLAAHTMQRPRRWDTPFGEMSDADVERALSVPPLDEIDPKPFPPTLALADIVRNDARIRHFRGGDIIVRKDEYGSSSFVVLAGLVGGITDDEEGLLGSPTERSPMNLLSSLAQLWRNARVPEARDIARYADLSLRHTDEDEARPFVQNLDALRAHRGLFTIGPGGMFGEIAALSRTPRTASCVALDDCTLLELRWQGLREIRRYDPKFREGIDALYRERSLRTHLRQAPLFAGLDPATLERLIGETHFETYGAFEWSSAFKRRVGEPEENLPVEGETTIVNEGDYADGLILVRSGFARASQKLAFGERTVRIAGKDSVFGLEVIHRHWRDGAPLRYRYSLSAIGYVDILRVPTALVEEYVLPQLGTERYRAMVQDRDFSEDVDPELINFVVDRRIVNGTAVMMINTERCVGCDDCVRACAAAHDGNPRFVRHGNEYGALMVANACMHCQDPVCLIGCPTGAIHQIHGGHVVIDDNTCIGCGTCAGSCPYDNIRMVEIRNWDGAFVLDDATKVPIAKATKCDLCEGQLGGPACQRACPHDALVRMDMRDHAAFGRWVTR
jgi:Fe-S-cluster-containing dehydrogenase component/CRP-like cAMP-binding protein